MEYEDNYIKHLLVLGDKPKARIELKVRSNSKPVIKEYELPFAIESN
jgi:ribosomal protein S8